MSNDDEMVLVVPRAIFDHLGSFQGINFEVERYLPELLSRQNNHFMRRGEAEDDPAHKQIIPYVILTHEGRILHYTRGKKSGEKRLRSKGSIGIGGHMNDGDETLFAVDYDAYCEGVRREVEEELEISGAYENRIAALLNDDSNDVGAVHLGVVHVFRLESPAVQAREKAIAGLEFLTPEELLERRKRLETWSQICLDHLDEILRRASL